MTRYAGPTTEILLKRIREEGGYSLDPSFALKILTHCQQMVNAGLRIITDSITLSVPKEKLIFNMRSNLPDAIDIVTIRENSRQLSKVLKLSEFSAYENTWWRNITGTRFEAFCQIGRELLFLYPGQAAISEVDITYTKLIPLLIDFDADYNTALELPDEFVNLALSLAEAILLLSTRRFNEVNKKLEVIKAEINKTINYGVGDVNI